MNHSNGSELPPRKSYAGIRRATLADTGPAAATLAEAFHDYVWTRWMLPQVNYEQRLLESFTVDLETTVKYLGEVWMTQDGASVAPGFSPTPRPSRNMTGISLRPCTGGQLAKTPAESKRPKRS